jgi:hypothetical protein
VAAIEGHQLPLPEPLGRGDDRGVDRSEGKVTVGARQVGDADPVGGEDRLGDQVSRREIAEKPDLGIGAEASAEQVDDLGDDEDGNDEWAWMGSTAQVMSIALRSTLSSVIGALMQSPVFGKKTKTPGNTSVRAVPPPGP